MLELSELVQQLRGELHRSLVASEDEPLRFELATIELEVEVAAVREAGGGGKVRFLVVAEAGGDVKATRSSTQRVKLTLNPVLAGSAAKPWIDDEAAPGEE